MSLTITPADVVPQANAKTKTGVSGATIVQGKAVYLDTDAGTYKLCQFDGTAAEGACRGIALTASSAGQPIVVATEGDVFLGADIVLPGRFHFTSATAGDIEVELLADIGSFPGFLGFGTEDNYLRLNIDAPGIEFADV